MEPPVPEELAMFCSLSPGGRGKGHRPQPRLLTPRDGLKTHTAQCEMCGFGAEHKLDLGLTFHLKYFSHLKTQKNCHRKYVTSMINNIQDKLPLFVMVARVDKDPT